MSQNAPNDSFTFAMGEFDATFPKDRLYATNHMWALPIDGTAGRFRFGLTAYAVRLLQDVYFLDWEVDVPAVLKVKQMIGAIESKKAESDLYSPVAGELKAINTDVLDDPALINADPYHAAWMIEIQAEDDTLLLTPDAYATHLESAWDVAQKTIKGQANV